eukprot:m.67131 g.67131  ORF g.67131 m.67131 type:complete len:61 (-) comp14075_c0_seq10:1118-1300(-)
MVVTLRALEATSIFVIASITATWSVSAEEMHVQSHIHFYFPSMIVVNDLKGLAMCFHDFF